jgi:outer membrane protein TolC
LSLREAEVVALFFNPHLRLARQRARVPRAGAAEAGRWEDPELGIDGERIIESVEHPWVLGGMLNLTIPLSGRNGAEKGKALAEATAAELQALAEEWRVLTELRLEWVEWSAACQRAELTRQLVQELEAVGGRADRLREAGELGPLDARLFHLERVRQTAKLRGYEVAGRVAELRLRSLLGLAPTADVNLVSSLDVPQTHSPAEQGSAGALVRHPRVRVARAEYEVAERTLRLEVRKQYPDLKLGGGFGTDEGDERALFGAALPLPLLNANRRAIAEARANRDAAKAAAEGAFEQLLGDAAAACAALEGALERLRYVEQELAPLADRQVEDAGRLARAGEFSALILLEALTTAHEAKLEVLDARVGAGLAQTRLDALLPAVPAGKVVP